LTRMDLDELMAMFFTASTNYPSITIERVILSLTISFAIGLFLFFMYRKTFTGVIYNRAFNISIVLTALIVTLVVIPISSNVALSLGTIGALSIIRFRTAVKDPKDIVFMFWAIAVGILSGAGLYIVAIIGTPMIGLFLFILSGVNFHSAETFLPAVNYSSEAESAVQSALPKNKLRSRTVTREGVELMVEVQAPQKDAPKVDQLLGIEGVRDASLVSYNAGVS